MTNTPTPPSSGSNNPQLPPSGDPMNQNQTTDPLDNAITAPRAMHSAPVIQPVEIPGVPPPSPWPKRLGRAATLALLFSSASCAWYGYQAWTTGKEFIEILPVVPMLVITGAIMLATLIAPIVIGMIKELVGDTSDAANKKPVVAQVIVSMIVAGIVVYLFDTSAGVIFTAVGTGVSKKLGFLSFLGWLGWTGHVFAWFKSLPALIEDETKDTPLALWSGKSVWAASAIAGTGIAAIFSHAYTWAFNSALHLLGASLACGFGLVLIAGIGGWMWQKSIRGAGKASSLYEQSKAEASAEQSWFTLIKFVILIVEMAVGLFIGLAMWPSGGDFGPFHLLSIITGVVSFLITYSFVGSAVNMAYHKENSRKTWYAIALSLLIATVTGIFSSSEMYALVSRNDRFEAEKAEVLKKSNEFMAQATTPAIVVAKALGGDAGKNINEGVEKSKSGVEKIRQATDRDQLKVATAEFMAGATQMTNRDDDRKLLSDLRVNPEPVAVQLFVDAVTSLFGSGTGYVHKGALLAALGLVFIFDFAALFAALITMARSPKQFPKAKSRQMIELENAAEEAKERAQLAADIAASNARITGTHQQPAPQSLLVTPTAAEVQAVSQPGGRIITTK